MSSASDDMQQRPNPSKGDGGGGSRKHRVYTANGYALAKDELTETQLRSLRKDLTVTAFNPMAKHFKTPAKSFRVFQSSARHIYLPRFYAEARFGPPARMDLAAGRSIDLVFNGTLRPVQAEIAATAMRVLRPPGSDFGGGGILQLPCGSGKTILALHVVSTLRRKALIVVHKEFLLHQWRERIATFLPQARVGIIQGPKLIIEDCDIVIGMIQSLTSRAYDHATVFSEFGLSIYDECHHLGAASFSKCMMVARTRCVLGLTATPDRADRLRRVFEWHIGPVIYRLEPGETGAGAAGGAAGCEVSSTGRASPRPAREPREAREVRVVRFSDPNVLVDERQCATHLRFSDGHLEVFRDSPMFRHRLLEHVCTSAPRKALLVDLIHEVASGDAERQVIVLSERIAHLRALSALLQETHAVPPDQCGFYIGGLKQRVLDQAATRKYLFASYQMASEGMDVPSLNTLVCATPKGDMEQALGRILRRRHPQCPPLVVDVVDTRMERLARSMQRRRRLYRQQGFRIREATLDGEQEGEEEEDQGGQGGSEKVEGVLAFR